MANNEYFSKSAPDPVGAYPHSRQAGDFLFLSGVGPRTPGTNEIPGNIYDDSGKLLDYDFESQCHAVFKNVKEILSSSKAHWQDLVDITVFITDMKKDFATFNEIYSNYFSEHRPCRTTVEVGSLPTDIAIELKCIAHVNTEDTA